MSLLSAPENIPFAVALLVMLGLAVLEVAAVLAHGSSAGGWLDGMLDTDGHGDHLLGWLHVGRVPVLMLIILFLTAFGLAGFVLQVLAQSLSGAYVPALPAGVAALLLALPAVRVGGFVLAKILPKDETSAVSLDALIGRAGIIVGAPARAGNAGQVRIRDEHGRSHYVLVEPDIDSETLDSGAEVLLVRRIGARYRAILNPHAGLIQP